MKLFLALLRFKDVFIEVNGLMRALTAWEGRGGLVIFRKEILPNLR
jgi:hypothetical protein